MLYYTHNELSADRFSHRAESTWISPCVNWDTGLRKGSKDREVYQNTGQSPKDKCMY